MKIRNKKNKIQLDIKRFFVPAIIEDICPKCGNIIIIDLMDDYLSYPEINEKQTITFYCSECEYEWEKEIILKMKIIENKEKK